MNANDPNFTSFYVSNLPSDANRKCCRGSILSWVLWPTSTSSEGGMFRALSLLSFGSQTSWILSRLKEVSRPKEIHVAAIPVNLAPRDSRSFSDVLKGKVGMTATYPPLAPVINLSSINEIEDCADKSILVREAKDFHILCNFPSLFALEGFDVLECKYLEGMQVVVKFKSCRAAEIFKANQNIWQKWFLRMEVIGMKAIRYKSVMWIKITGVPILAWDESNFSSIAGFFGKFLVNTCS
ncbi:unnamed protein product [Lactuca saligna]|uniref:DUF4283 domain-containing protein n=1 Tax=Lactuca saligna TaxID=75948 RepID=A0AA36E5U7_LACSI|nr:unnamed protein product [Lactuca saligna]